MKELQRHKNGSLMQGHLDALTKKDILEILEAADYVTREDVLGLLVACHWAHERLPHQDHPVLQHTFEEAVRQVEGLPGMEHSILRGHDPIQPNHADNLFAIGQHQNTPPDGRGK